MNSTTGEIKEFTQREVTEGIPAKTGFDVPLTKGEAELLADLDPSLRMEAIREWKSYKKEFLKRTPFNEVVKIKYGFLFGYTAAKMGN